MTSEAVLNNYYNAGKFNSPNRIGYLMDMIRKLKPLTEEEWMLWYLENCHDEKFLDGLAEEMQHFIPEKHQISKKECKSYIYDVMFRRTFEGYDKEKQALKLLRKMISPSVKEAPKEWDTKYFIDFCIYEANKQLIGIQLKPETFFLGKYQNKVDIEGKMEAFCLEYDAEAYVLAYQADLKSGGLVFSNPKCVEMIKQRLRS